MKESRVVVIGAGIVGASIAYHLAKAGASVTVIEKALPASGATGASFAWIGKPGAQDRVDASTPLRLHVIDDWRALSKERSDIVVSWTGSLLWHKKFLSGSYLPTAGEQQFLTGDEVMVREPALRTAPSRALHSLGDGAVDPVAVTKALLLGAADLGTEILTNTSVMNLVVEQQGVVGVDTSAGRISADTVVLAAGADGPRLVEPLGVSLPITSSPALMMKIAAPPELVNEIVWSELVEARQLDDGLILVPMEYHGEDDEKALRKVALQVKADIAQTFAVDVDDLELVDVRIGRRPMPDDHLPLIGRLSTFEDVYVAIMHSGLSLAPTVGRLVAQEILEGVESDLLQGLRPDR